MDVDRFAGGVEGVARRPIVLGLDDRAYGVVAAEPLFTPRTLPPPLAGVAAAPPELSVARPAMEQQAADADLLELARASGLAVEPRAFHALLELLRCDVSPQGVVVLLRAIKDAKLRAALQQHRA